MDLPHDIVRRVNLGDINFIHKLPENGSVKLLHIGVLFDRCNELPDVDFLLLLFLDFLPQMFDKICKVGLFQLIVTGQFDETLVGELAGKTIAVQSTGKPEEIFLSGSDPRIPQTVEVLSIENRSVQYAMLACGYVDGIAAHETGILQYMKDNAIDFRILEEPLLVTGLGIAFAKNDSRGLDTQLNAVLAQMRTDGTLEQILGKYLEHPSQYLEVDTIGT